MASRAPMPGLPAPPKQPVRVLHRRLGLIGALFLTLLVGSGIALQHPKAFGLDTVYVTATWLLDWYGVTAPDAAVFVAGSHRVARIGDAVLLDGEWLELAPFHLNGAVMTEDSIALLAPNELAILTSDGVLIDRMPTPAAATALGVDASVGRVNLRTSAGEFVLDEALANWDPATPGAAIRWSESVITGTDADEVRMLQARYRERLITVERLLLDLHSGRVFGAYGTWVIDAAALLLLALAVSGLLLAGRR